MRLPHFLRSWFGRRPAETPVIETSVHVHDRLLGPGKRTHDFGVFSPEFPGSPGPLQFYVDYRRGKIPKEQYDLFVHVANRYPVLIERCVEVIQERMQQPKELVSPSLRPLVIDARDARRRFVIRFANLLDDYDWYVTFDLDDEVIACGPWD